MISNLIYDIGMHNGQDTEFYLKKGFRVVAIEANTDFCKACAKKFQREISSHRLIIINKAISDVCGEVTFYANKQNSVWGTINPNWAKSVIMQHGMPYFMKIDIEGSDILCLRGLLDEVEKPKYISIESSATSISETFEQLRLLTGLGYKKFKIIPQNDVHNQWCPHPPREGNFVDHRFEYDSSGLFGEEVPGRWQSIDRIRWQYIRIHFECRIIGEWNGFLRDFPSYKVRRLLRVVFRRGIGWYDTHATL